MNKKERIRELYEIVEKLHGSVMRYHGSSEHFNPTTLAHWEDLSGTIEVMLDNLRDYLEEEEHDE